MLVLLFSADLNANKIGFFSTFARGREGKGGEDLTNQIRPRAARDKKHFLFFLTALPLAVGLGLLGFDGTLSTVVIIGAIAVVVIRFLRKAPSQYFHLKRLHELEADKYAAETVGPAP